MNSKLKKAPKPKASDGRRRLTKEPEAEAGGAAAVAKPEPEPEPEPAPVPEPAPEPAATAEAPKEVILAYDGVAGRLRLKLKIPKSWASKPASKLLSTVVKAANAKAPSPEAQAVASKLRMARSGGTALAEDAPLACLVPGETIRVTER